MKKILLLCQQQGCPIELSPARYQLINVLKDLNYGVYVFIAERIFSKAIRNNIDCVVNTIGLTNKQVQNKIEKVNPEVIIAFTYEDARILYTLPRVMKKTTFIYFNLEIYTPSMEQYLTGEKHLFSKKCILNYIYNKFKEVLYVRQCKLFVIQDTLREKTSKKYLIKHSHTILVPNSYVLNEKEQNEVQRSGIIYSGGINRLQAKSLIEELDKISDIPITFAGWSDGCFKKQYNKIRRDHPNIKVYDQRLMPEQLSAFLQPYAIGLVWYTATKDENINNIGLASGKLFKHLSLGQPVIVMDCPGISKVVNKLRLGIVIYNVAELKDAYELIMKQYSVYQKHVMDAYKKFFDYKRVIQPFLRELERGS